ncbi:MAG TPA: hypothetical protein VIY52_23270 [Streptosporangiaceae bacterium]
MGSLDLPDEPGEPDRARHADHGAADTARARETPDPEERGRAYEALRAHADAEAADRAGQASEADGRADGTGEVPQILEARAGQDESEPTERPVDSSADRPEPDRDGSSQPTAEREADTTEAIGRVREVEPAISADVRTVEQENRYGGWLEGFNCRLKDEDRLKEKIAEKLRFQPDREEGEIIREIPDAIRYTFCLRSESYTAGYYDIKQRLEDREYEMYYSKNWWTNPEYKGINTRWVTPDGQRFEVQFHTPESFHAKQHITHAAYERIRDRRTSDAERAELKSFQYEVSSRLQVPGGAQDVSDHEKKGL